LSRRICDPQKENKQGNDDLFHSNRIWYIAKLQLLWQISIQNYSEASSNASLATPQFSRIFA